MFQADLSTAISQANESEPCDSFKVETNTRCLGTNANIQSSFTGIVDVDLSRIVDLPRLPVWRMPATRLHALQEWEGHVVEIGDKEFIARLTDITAGAPYEQEEAIIPLSEISDDDAAKMREGSIFRWVIGHERSASGTKKRVSQIVFRDLPAITEADLRAGEAWARETMQSLDL